MTNAISVGFFKKKTCNTFMPLYITHLGSTMLCFASTGHGNFPYLCGNLNDVIVSPLLCTCYKNAQSLSRSYEQYGASTVQPISEEMQLLLTVYYLVQLGEFIQSTYFRHS